MDETPKRLTTEELQDRTERLAEIYAPLHALSETDGWRILRETFGKQRDQYYEQLSRNLMKGAEIDQRKLDYNRGFFDSIEDLLEAPENAEAILRKALERLQKRREEDPRGDSE